MAFLIRQVVLDSGDATNGAVVIIDWNGGRRAELHVSRIRAGQTAAPAQWRPPRSSVVHGVPLSPTSLMITSFIMREIGGMKVE